MLQAVIEMWQQGDKRPGTNDQLQRTVYRVRCIHDTELEQKKCFIKHSLLSLDRLHIQPILRAV